MWLASCHVKKNNCGVAFCLEKGPDTVGQRPNAAHCASNVPSLKAYKSLESNVVIGAMSLGKRMTNSIGRFCETMPHPLRLQNSPVRMPSKNFLASHQLDIH
jgi:hypothetical protein